MIIFPLCLIVIDHMHDIHTFRYGFLTAMGSNLAFQTRNVISKKFMKDRCEHAVVQKGCVGGVRQHGMQHWDSMSNEIVIPTLCFTVAT